MYIKLNLIEAFSYSVYTFSEFNGEDLCAAIRKRWTNPRPICLKRLQRSVLSFTQLLLNNCSSTSQNLKGVRKWDNLVLFWCWKWNMVPRNVVKTTCCLKCEREEAIWDSQNLLTTYKNEEIPFFARQTSEHLKSAWKPSRRCIILSKIRPLSCKQGRDLNHSLRNDEAYIN